MIEDGREFSSYNPSTGLVHIKVPKKVPGQVFPDLDLLTKLLEPKKTVDNVESARDTGRVLIEEIGQSAVSENQILEEHETEIDWNLTQNVEDIQVCLDSAAKYGFNNLYQGKDGSDSELAGFGKTITELAQDLIDIDDIDSSTIASRRACREYAENAKFDSEYYMCDVVFDEDIQRILEFKPEFYKILKEAQKRRSENVNSLAAIDSELLVFSDLENEMLQRLCNKEYLIDPDMEQIIYLGLVDIIFAYCYNVRTTEGENTAESAWTICRLSGTLSALESFSNIESVLKCILRRSISYPLYRSFALSQKVFLDLVMVFKLGKRAILKALLQIMNLVSHHDQMFLMNRIYLTDYCVWVQSCSDKRISSLASQLHHFNFNRELAGDWNLSELERQAHL